MYRSTKLLESAKGQPCANCNCNDGTTVAAHSNQQEHGKGKSIKAHDLYIAHLCFTCHAWLDQGSSKMDPTNNYLPTREDKKEMWRKAHDKTMLRLFESGLVVAV